MFRNQYIISDEKINDFEKFDLTKQEFAGLHVYYHKEAEYTHRKKNDSEIMLTGFILDPFNPSYSNQQILDNILVNCQDADSLIKELQKYSGRYVILFRNPSTFVAINDACAFKHLLYSFHNGHIYLSSSQKLLHDLVFFDLQINEIKKSFFDRKEFKDRQSPWIGDEGLDDRVFRLLSNHYLNLLEKKLYRTPLFYRSFTSEEEIFKYAQEILQGNIVAISNRRSLLFALSAGLDSRVLLSASRAISDKIQYFTFWSLDRFWRVYPDHTIPRKLSKKLGIKYKWFRARKLTEEFLEVYKNEHIIPRILPKTRNIQYHYFHNRNNNLININGNGSGVVRHDHPGGNGFEDILKLAKDKHPYAIGQLKKWYDNTTAFARENNILLTDLYHWEQRLGNWGALYPFEQDIAIEEFSPFNNKEYFFALWQIDPKARSLRGRFFNSFIKAMWKETLSEPINPPPPFFVKCMNLIIRNVRPLRAKLKSEE